MYKEISKLIIYVPEDESCLLSRLSKIFEDFENNSSTVPSLIKEIYSCISSLLKTATDYGFNDNLWHNYLSFYLITHENPFSITCEKTGANNGSVNVFAKNDFKVFKSLFDYDFTKIEEPLDINCF